MFNTWTRNSGIINAGNPAQASWMMRSFQVNSTKVISDARKAAVTLSETQVLKLAL